MKLESIISVVDQSVDTFKNWLMSIQNIGPTPSISFGITTGINKNDFKLAIRSRNLETLQSDLVQNIAKNVKNECDFGVTGYIRAPRRIKFTQADNDKFTKEKIRPLRAGYSVGHHLITAGTLGCFAKIKNDIVMLSNNHVLANSNEANIGDLILQPGKHDGGNSETDVCGKLYKFNKIEKTGNIMDAAIAVVSKDVLPVDFSIPRIGNVNVDNIISPKDILGEKVQKVGRTTGHTRGKVTAVNVKNVGVNYGVGKVYFFDQQMEIVGEDSSGSFSAGGDSGSFVVDMDNNPVGLLFAGSDSHTIINPIEPIIKYFNINLLG